MITTKWKDQSIQLIAILSFLVFASGFAFGIKEILSPPSQTLSKHENPPAPIVEKDRLLVGLGDSLTRGIGDEKGLGYIGIVHAQLQKKAPNSKILLTNLAISGQTSSDFMEQLKQKQVQQLIQQADWLPLTIGGNDLKASVANFQSINLKQAEENRKRFEKNLDAILTTIRTHNRQAPIFLFSLYNPYIDLADQELTSKLVLEWNETIQRIGQQHANIIVIPTFDLFQLQPKHYLASDHFHPNHLGYQRMAARLMQIIQDTSKGEAKK